MSCSAETGEEGSRTSDNGRLSLPRLTQNTASDIATSLKTKESLRRRSSTGSPKLPFVATFSPNIYGDFDITDRRIHPTCFDPNPLKCYTKETIKSVRCHGKGLKEAVAGNISHVMVEVELVRGERRPISKGREDVLSYLGAYFRSGPGLAHCDVVEVGPLQFEVSWMPPVSGLYTLAIHFAGVSAADSPFKINVLQPIPQAQTSYIAGGKLKDAIAGAENSFTLIANDQHGNIIKRVGDNNNPFVVEVNGPDNLQSLLMSGRKAGTYEASYIAKVAGSYSLSITIRDEHIIGSPFPLQVEPGSICAAENCTVLGSTTVVAGLEASLIVVAHDGFGNPCTTGGELFQASLKLKRPPTQLGRLESTFSSGSSFSYCEDTTEINIYDEQNGTYRCTYLPKLSGKFELQVKLMVRNKSLYNNTAIFGSSTSEIVCKKCTENVVVLPGPTDPKCSIVTTSPSGETDGNHAISQNGDMSEELLTTIQAHQLTMGNEVLVTCAVGELVLEIKAMDSFGNPRRKGGDVCKAQLTHVKEDEEFPSSLSGYNMHITDGQDGTYNLSLKYQVADSYLLHVHMNGDGVHGSPFPLHILPGTTSHISDYLNFLLHGGSFEERIQHCFQQHIYIIRFQIEYRLFSS